MTSLITVNHYSYSARKKQKQKTKTEYGAWIDSL